MLKGEGKEFRIHARNEKVGVRHCRSSDSHSIALEFRGASKAYPTSRGSRLPQSLGPRASRFQVRGLCSGGGELIELCCGADSPDSPRGRRLLAEPSKPDPTRQKPREPRSIEPGTDHRRRGVGGCDQALSSVRSVRRRARRPIQRSSRLDSEAVDREQFELRGKVLANQRSFVVAQAFTEAPPADLVRCQYAGSAEASRPAGQRVHRSGLKLDRRFQVPGQDYSIGFAGGQKRCWSIYDRETGLFSR